MLTEETFLNMDLIPCYINNKIVYTPSKNKFYVYVIKNTNYYYVGLSSNLISRIKGHKSSNTNNIKNGGEMYILEILNDYKTTRTLEVIWITWFRLNANCINKDNCRSYMLFHVRTYYITNTKYELLINSNVIYGLKIYDNYEDIRSGKVGFIELIDYEDIYLKKLNEFINQSQMNKY
jgi:hypothetical protein